MQSLSTLIMCTNSGRVNYAVDAVNFCIVVQQRGVDVVKIDCRTGRQTALCSSRECLHSLLPRWRWWLAVAEPWSGEAPSRVLTHPQAMSNVARCHCCANSQP